MSNTSTELALRVAAIRTSIADAARSAGRDPDSILLLAVSKRQSEERLRDAYACGVRDFGENYIQGLEQHIATLSGEISGGEVRWHFIGQLQSNKAKRLTGVHLFHSLDSLKLARRLGDTAASEGRTQACLLNINISQQASKSGILSTEAEELLDKISSIKGIDIQGLMCIPSPDEEARAAFARLRILRSALQAHTDFRLRELSMGMSSSYQDAIAEGATIVRVGTALFGPRES